MKISTFGRNSSVGEVIHDWLFKTHSGFMIVHNDVLDLYDLWRSRMDFWKPRMELNCDFLTFYFLTFYFWIFYLIFILIFFNFVTFFKNKIELNKIELKSNWIELKLNLGWGRGAIVPPINNPGAFWYGVNYL